MCAYRTQGDYVSDFRHHFENNTATITRTLIFLYKSQIIRRAYLMDVTEYSTASSENTMISHTWL